MAKKNVSGKTFPSTPVVSKKNDPVDMEHMRNYIRELSEDNPKKPLLPLDQVIAAQGPIDTSKNAPEQVVTPQQKGKLDAKAQSKPSASKGGYYGLNYCVRGDGARKLFAHTAAWLELTGLIHGKSAPVPLIRELGGSAYDYHTRKGNFQTDIIGGQEMVSLTDDGMKKFIARQHGGHGQYDQVDMDHYMLMMLSGEHDDRLVKSKGAIRKVA